MQILPLLNDLVNSNPGVKYLCIISGAATRLQTKQSPSRVFWKFTVVCDNKEYVYFANSESHMLDIERPRSMGKAVNIWMEEETEDLNPHSIDGDLTSKGHEKVYKTYYAEGVELTKETMATFNGTTGSTPDWDAIARRDKRHEYALELFKAWIPKKIDGEEMRSMLKDINDWVEYSMTGEVPVKDGKTLDKEPF